MLARYLIPSKASLDKSERQKASKLCLLPELLCREELRAGKAAAKAEKAAQQPPRLGKVKFEAEPVQVDGLCWSCNV